MKKLILTYCFALSVLFTLSQTKDTTVNKRKNYFFLSSEVGISLPGSLNSKLDHAILNPLIGFGLGYERRFKYNFAFETGFKYFFGQYGARSISNIERKFQTLNIEIAGKKDWRLNKKLTLNSVIGAYSVLYYNSYNTGTFGSFEQKGGMLYEDLPTYGFSILTRIGITKLVNTHKISLMISNYLGGAVYDFTANAFFSFNPLLTLFFYV